MVAKGQLEGLSPDLLKIGRCSEKFEKAWGKANTAGDCVVQTAPCLNQDEEAQAAAENLCPASPSGAFLN